MVRLLTAAALAMMTWPAWAMCSDIKEPVRLCVDGVCEDTFAVRECSFSPNGALYDYENGVGLGFTADTGAMAVYRGESRLVEAVVTCTELDASGAGCPGGLTR